MAAKKGINKLSGFLIAAGILIASFVVYLKLSAEPERPAYSFFPDTITNDPSFNPTFMGIVKHSSDKSLYVELNGREVEVEITNKSYIYDCKDVLKTESPFRNPQCIFSKPQANALANKTVKVKATRSNSQLSAELIMY